MYTLYLEYSNLVLVVVATYPGSAALPHLLRHLPHLPCFDSSSSQACLLSFRLF
jgi:hypothetical protein